MFFNDMEKRGSESVGCPSFLRKLGCFVCQIGGGTAMVGIKKKMFHFGCPIIFHHWHQTGSLPQQCISRPLSNGNRRRWTLM